MKNWMINIAAKIGGVSRLWGFLDGKKTAIAGVAGLLSGVAGIVGKLVPLIEKHDAAALLGFIQGLPNDPAWLLAVGGLGALGLGHKLEKSSGATPPAVAAPVAPIEPQKP